MSTTKAFDPDWIDPVNSIERKARIFHKSHPEVFELAERLMTDALSRVPRCGIGFVWERMRWYYKIESTDAPFKLSNNYRAYYARWLLQKHPEWKNRINIRHVKRDLRRPERLFTASADEGHTNPYQEPSTP